VQDALNWLAKRTNQPSLQVRPLEMQLQLEAQRKLYLEQFVKILDDTRKRGVLVTFPVDVVCAGSKIKTNS
jgi:hypothetical protein